MVGACKGVRWVHGIVFGAGTWEDAWAGYVVGAWDQTCCMCLLLDNLCPAFLIMMHSRRSASHFATQVKMEPIVDSVIRTLAPMAKRGVLLEKVQCTCWAGYWGIWLEATLSY